MSKKTAIQWCDATWNVARGCTKVSSGCKFCYMMRDGEKFGYDGSVVKRTTTVFDMPLKYDKVQSEVWGGDPLIFTSSLTDLFHPDIDSFRDEVWDIIKQCPHLTFLILTKRPERIMDHLPGDWGRGYRNVWLGISVEDQENYDSRMKSFISIPAVVKFLSVEPMLGWICFEISAASAPFDWVIVGGESGNDNGNWKYRRCYPSWIESIVRQCDWLGVPVFVKQTGTFISKSFGLSDRHGGDIDEWPHALATCKVREFPKV